MKNLCNWAGVSGTGRSDYRALNPDEIRILHHGGLVNIGSHTVTHSALSSDNGIVLGDEILKSKVLLEQVLSEKIESFSYPFGSHEDFSLNTEMIVKNAGYQFACANYPGPITKLTNSDALPRYLVRDWNKDQFIEKMSGWVNG